MNRSARQIPQPGLLPAPPGMANPQTIRPGVPVPENSFFPEKMQGCDHERTFTIGEIAIRFCHGPMGGDIGQPDLSIPPGYRQVVASRNRG